MNNEDQLNKIAEDAIKRVFFIIGVDISNAESVEEFREDLRFGRKIRKASNGGFMAVVAMIFVAIAASTWVGIVDGIKYHR